MPRVRYKFAYPLLQVGKRVFTCATTPAPYGSFFSRFTNTVKERNEKGDFFFRLVNHSLVCEDCAARGLAEKCAHKLMLIPPWKSVLRFKKMRALVPESRAEEFEAEVYGVIAKQSNGYIPSKLADAWAKRPYLKQLDADVNDFIYVGVDPPSHQSSRFGIAAILYGSKGEIAVLGLGETRATRCDTLQLQALIGDFIVKLRMHPWAKYRVIVPIIEANNNSVLALSLLRVFQAHPPTNMPFIKRFFASDICDNVGVLTNDINKAAMCQTTFQALLDGRVFSAEKAFTVGRDAFDPNQETPSYQDTANLLALELASMRDMPNGKISGKVDSSQGDDLALAFMMALYWSFTCRALGVS